MSQGERRHDVSHSGGCRQTSVATGIGRGESLFLGSRVADLERRLGDNVLKRAPARICATLARLVGPEPVKLTHEQLADLVGTSRETTTKVLGDLAARDLIALKRVRIIIRDEVALRQLAENDDLTVNTGGCRARTPAT